MGFSLVCGDGAPQSTADEQMLLLRLPSAVRLEVFA